MIRLTRLLTPEEFEAVDFDPAALVPARLALEHRALLRSSAAREWHIARLAGI